MNTRSMMILCVVLLAVVVGVFGLPAKQDESVFGPVGEAQEFDTFNPQDPQGFIKWRQLKKLLLLG